MSLPLKTEESSTLATGIFIVTPDPLLLDKYLQKIDIKSDESSTIKLSKREEESTTLVDTTTLQTTIQTEIYTTTNLPSTIVDSTTENDEGDDDYAQPDEDKNLKASCIAALCSSG